jgi:phage shock protein A
MSPAAARDYIAGYIATLKLTERELAARGEERKRWEDRAALARDRGAPELAAGAEGEAQKLRSREEALAGEAALLRGQIEAMKARLPGLAARERRVDPDLLEEELLIALGRNPGEGEKLRAEGALRKREEEAALETALEELKGRMKPGERG